MGRFIEGSDRRQRLLLPDCIDDYIAEESPVRVVDIFVDELDLAGLGFEGAAATGRPAYHPAMLLKLRVYLDSNYRREAPKGGLCAQSAHMTRASVKACHCYGIDRLLGDQIQALPVA